MVNRAKEGYENMSDNGVDDALQAFVLDMNSCHVIRKIEREMDSALTCVQGMAGSTVHINLLRVLFNP